MSAPSVEIGQGLVRGATVRATSRFLGVPFAEPAVGNRRWKSPEPIRSRNDHDGTRAGKVMPQDPTVRERSVGPEGAQQEGALELNIWTPSVEGSRPVMVWFHGGSFVSGSASVPWYAGESLAHNGDVVVVTCNYRLGALGFLRLDDLFGDAFPGSGNLGILDQLAALEWVAVNIGAFGGDPSQVTVFGQSAGATSILALMTLPRTRRLFQRAIVQSPGGVGLASTERATWVAEQTVSALGVAPGDVDGLLSVPTSTILQAQSVVAGRLAAGEGPSEPSEGLPVPYQPVIDGSPLTESPLDALRAGIAFEVDLLIGTTADEFALYALGDQSLANLDDEELRRRTGALGATKGAALFESYRRAHPEMSPAERYVRQLTDAIFTVPVRRIADAHGGRTFRYRFTHPSTAFDGRLAAGHGVEIPFVFDTLDDEWAKRFLGDPTPAARSLADLVSGIWADFARAGNTNWNPWDKESVVYELGAQPRGVSDPLNPVLSAWAGIV